MKFISLTHAADIDGVASAALISIKYKMSVERVFFSNYSKEDLSYVEKSMQRFLKDDPVTLFITDLGMNTNLIPDFLRIINKVKAKGGRVIWFDHHPWKPDMIKKVASKCDFAIIGENPKFCATEITYRNLKLSGSFLEKLVKLVHYADFALDSHDKGTHNTIGTYAMSITYFNNMPHAKRDRELRHLVKLLTQQKFKDKRVIDAAKTFENLNNKRIKSMVKRLYPAGNTASIGFSMPIQSNQGCAAIRKESGKDICIYVNTEVGKASLRSVKADTSILSHSFGGGGHPHASGFNIDMKKFHNFKTEKDKRAFALAIEKKINSIY